MAAKATGDKGFLMGVFASQASSCVKVAASI